MTEEQKEILITCCKCHGKGVYDVAVYNESGEIIGWNPTLCELCKGTGKISLQFYEDIKKRGAVANCIKRKLPLKNSKK